MPAIETKMHKFLNSRVRTKWR